MIAADAEEQSPLLATALSIAEDAWNELQHTPYVQQRLGAVPERLPDLSFAEAERKSRLGRSLLRRLSALDLSALPHELALTMRLVRFRAEMWSEEADWYWLVIDPRGIGFYCLFLPTAYCGGSLLNLVHGQLNSFSFEGSEDIERYLSLLSDYAQIVEQFTLRTAGQAERGIRIPKPQVPQARVLVSTLKSRVRDALVVSPQRLRGVPAKHFSHKVEHLISTTIEPAFDRALEMLSDRYLERAPDRVGISQYPGGSSLYVKLVKSHTTLTLTPEQVHEVGLARMAELEESMQAVRSTRGSKGNHAEFISQLNRDPSWHADSVGRVASLFECYLDRLRPHLARCFARVPRASYGVSPLPKALEPSMTFGFFDPPSTSRARGVYLFNAANLMKQPLFQVPSLAYHELVPGHHLHLAMQQENEALHPFRKYNFINAYNEGWAEYAATLAGELGMYEKPEERYGRFMFDAFLTSRLVVDTGMNVLGWTLEEGRKYMREHSGLSEREIMTESLRYSCDRPGQALAYKLGDTQLLVMRERMQRALGSRFDLRDFHTAVLTPGGLPLPDLEWHIDRQIEDLKQGGRPG